MQVTIISDIHNNEVNLKKVLDFCAKKKIETIICCGDVASKETLDFLNDNFSGNILLTFGNAEYDDLRKLGEDKEYKKTFLFPDFGKVVIEKRNVAFVHYPEIAKRLARTGKYDFVFYGHTHKPWTEKGVADENGKEYIMLNPGTTGGEIYLPTFAVWDTEGNKFELVRIHELK